MLKKLTLQSFAVPFVHSKSRGSRPAGVSRPVVGGTPAGAVCPVHESRRRSSVHLLAFAVILQTAAIVQTVVRGQDLLILRANGLVARQKMKRR